VAYVPAQLPGSTLPAPALPPSHWLAANADRERAIDVLRAGFTEGRLTQEEFDERAARVYRARTYGELGALVADLPAGVTAPVGLPMTPLPGSSVRANPPIAGLILTAIVVFTLAALFTGMALIAHQTQQVVHLTPYVPKPPGAHLLPAIKPIH
jgi:uncharacterized protein DUF1707